jgi:acetyl-CoA synthase
MSKLICSTAIGGAVRYLAEARTRVAAAVAAHGPDHAVEFPETAYYLPIIYSLSGRAVRTLADLAEVLEDAGRLIPPAPAEECWLPYLGVTLDAGVAALFACEALEAVKYLDGPAPKSGIWLGAASDVIMRERGVEFVDGTAPGFAAITGAAPTVDDAVRIARELQEKNLYVFMAGGVDGASFAEQLASAGVQLGWETRLVPFGPDVSGLVYALGFACRAALAFGGVKPGDGRANLLYNKDRVFAFVLALGQVDAQKYSAAAGALNFGFPVIADTDIPQVLPTGVCTYEHVVSNVPLDKMVERALEVRGCKVRITKIPVPVSCGAAFEGEVIRKPDVHAEFGGNKTPAFEFLTSVGIEDIDDNDISVLGPDIDQVAPGTALPLGIWVEVAGRKMQVDFEPILERQIHHLLNQAEGVWHMGQRDIVWTRISKQAYAKGFRLRDYGVILHAKLLSEYPAIVDKVKVTLITDEAEVRRRLEHARKVYDERNRRLESMTDDAVETFYSCLLCQSFAPNHVCVISPERAGLCGAYTWLDGKAAHEIDATGPNQPVPKGHCLDAVRGVWSGVNDYVRTQSHKSVERVCVYSIMDSPMTSCGCFEAIVAYVPECNGVMVVHREHAGNTPSGMKFSTLAGTVGGGAQTPGFLGCGKVYLTSRKFLFAEGGHQRLVWMPKDLKELLRADLEKRCAEVGAAGLLDKVADETVAVEAGELRAYLEKVGHPALNLPPMEDFVQPADAGEAPAPAESAAAASPSAAQGGSSLSQQPGVAASAEIPVPGRPGTEARPAVGAATASAAGAVASAAPAPTAAGLASLKAEIMAEVRAGLRAELTREIASDIIATLQRTFLGQEPTCAPTPSPSAAPAPAAVPAAPTPDTPSPAPVAPSATAATPSAAALSTSPLSSPKGGATATLQHAAVSSAPLSPELRAAARLSAVATVPHATDKVEQAILEVTLGATTAQGGTRGRTYTVGGAAAMPFMACDGTAGRRPLVALEVYDRIGPKYPQVLRDIYGDLVNDPAAWAKACVHQYGADLISLRLDATHPERGGVSPEAAAETAKAVLAAVDVPLIVTGHAHFESVNAAFKEVAKACAGENLLLSWAEQDNWRTLAGAALAYGHTVASQSPIDVNIAKQMNILLTGAGLPASRIVMDPMTGALGYGLEYCVSVMERIRSTALGGDPMLALPLIVNPGFECARVKEYRAPEADFPAWGDLASRARHWELATALALLHAGADILVMYHPLAAQDLQAAIAGLRDEE